MLQTFTKLFNIGTIIILALSLVVGMLGCAPTRTAVDHNSRGMELYFEGKYEKAVAEFTRAIKLDPNYADAYSNRGNAYAAIGQYDLAIADHNKAIELDPEEAFLYLPWLGLL
jgi:tetratricopeptide (TPR) repeat protein